MDPGLLYADPVPGPEGSRSKAEKDQDKTETPESDNEVFQDANDEHDIIYELTRPFANPPIRQFSISP